MPDTSPMTAEDVASLPEARSLRLRIEATIEQLVALLDEIDVDPDLEADQVDILSTRSYADDREHQDEGCCPVEDHVSPY